MEESVSSAFQLFLLEHNLECSLIFSDDPYDDDPQTHVEDLLGFYDPVNNVIVLRIKAITDRYLLNKRFARVVTDLEDAIISVLEHEIVHLIIYKKNVVSFDENDKYDGHDFSFCWLANNIFGHNPDQGYQTRMIV